MKIKLIIVQLILFGSLYGQSGNVTISGHISDQSNGEDLINATVFVEELKTGVVSNKYGFFSLTLPSGKYTLSFSYLGFQEVERFVNLSKDMEIDLELSPESAVLDELVITAETKDAHVQEVGMSRVELDIEAIKKIPALLGEVDLVKALQLLPGVGSVGEGSSGFYVRGGNVDQNLILLDEAPVYNASHLLGFFSVFNPDAIKDVQFYKGAIPANYGGRLSSVVDIRMKEGNSKKFQGSAGIGSLSSRLTLEGPIGESASFMIAGRRTYVDLFTKLSSDPETKNSVLYFYDLNAKLNYKINKNNRLFLSAYLGRDEFGVDGDFESGYGNKTTTLRWNHIFNQKVFSNLTLYASDYGYRLAQPEDVEAFEWTSDLKDYGIKYDVGAYLNPRSTLKIGLHSILHDINPGDIRGLGTSTIFNSVNIPNTKGIENALYALHEYELSSKLKVNYGLRLSSHSNIGPQTVNNYDNNYEYIDSTVYTGSGSYNTDLNLEPRFGLRYTINEKSSIKLSYNRTAQYIQLASNTTSETPLDIWFLNSPNVKPQLADQFAAGYFRNFSKAGIEASLELYYKNFTNAVDFKDHAQLLFNDQLEGDLRFGNGRSYGAELLIKKSIGKLTGWFGYTYSTTEKQIDQINNGQWYFAKHDRTHDLSIVGSYELNRKWTLSSTFVYKTGSAVTFPVGKYYQFDTPVPIYSERNDERMPAYHRLDFAATWQMDKKLFGKAGQSLVFSIYNAYARKNAYSINFREDETDSNKTLAEKTYLFSIIPSVTYNLKF